VYVQESAGERLIIELARAVPASLDEDALDSLAERLAPRLARRLESVPRPQDGWLTAKGAAEYLGISVTALHKLTSARLIPFEQDGPGCKLWFRREELDAWRRSGGHHRR
jgi:excisionase family DNA binding protein